MLHNGSEEIKGCIYLKEDGFSEISAGFWESDIKLTFSINRDKLSARARHCTL